MIAAYRSYVSDVEVSMSLDRVDPKKEIIGILMAQSMMQFETPERELQIIAYAAINE